MSLFLCGMFCSKDKAEPARDGGGEADVEAGGAQARRPPVHLRLDYITDEETRSLLFAQRTATLIALGLLAWEVQVKYKKASGCGVGQQAHGPPSSPLLQWSCCTACPCPCQSAGAPCRPPPYAVWQLPAPDRHPGDCQRGLWERLPACPAADERMVLFARACGQPQRPALVGAAAACLLARACPCLALREYPTRPSPHPAGQVLLRSAPLRSCRRRRRHCRTHDRHMMARFAGIGLVFETLTVGVWLAANSYLLAVPCEWFSPTVNALAFVMWFWMFTSFWLHIAQGLNMLPEREAFSQAAAADAAAAALRRPAAAAQPSDAASSLPGASGSDLGGWAPAPADPSPARSDALLGKPPMQPGGEQAQEEAEAAHAAARAAMAKAGRRARRPRPSSQASSGALAGAGSSRLRPGSEPSTCGWSSCDSETETEAEKGEPQQAAVGPTGGGGGGGTGRHRMRRSHKLTLLALWVLWLPAKACLLLILLMTLGERALEEHSCAARRGALPSPAACMRAAVCTHLLRLNLYPLLPWSHAGKIGGTGMGCVVETPGASCREW